MAQDFGRSLLRNFKGKAVSTPVRLCTPIDGQPLMSKIVVNWSEYTFDIGAGINSPNVGIVIDLGMGAGQALSSIRGVSIDNTEVASPVFLEARDTKHTITCPDYASVSGPVLTSDTKFVLYVGNILSASFGKQTTTLYFTSVPLAPSYTDEYNQVQPQARGSGINNFQTPVLGDKLASQTSTISNGALSSGTYDTYLPAIIAPLVNSFICITNISIVISNGATQPKQLDYRIRGSLSGQILVGHAEVTNATVCVLNLSNLQLTLDGNQNIYLETLALSSIQPSSISAYITYASIQIPALS